MKKRTTKTMMMTTKTTKNSTAYATLAAPAAGFYKIIKNHPSNHADQIPKTTRIILPRAATKVNKIYHK